MGANAKAYHREDVKALLRKRYGTVVAFQQARGLRGQQVRDLLRGQSNSARDAVAAELGIEPDELVITHETLPVCGADATSDERGGYSQNVEGR